MGISTVLRRWTSNETLFDLKKSSTKQWVCVPRPIPQNGKEFFKNCFFKKFAICIKIFFSRSQIKISTSCQKKEKKK